MRVTCSNVDCSYTWNFKPRVSSHRLKKSYIVKCPKCRQPVFLRVKRLRLNDIEKRKITQTTLEEKVVEPTGQR